MVKSATEHAPSRKSDGSAHSQIQKGSAKKSAKGKAQTPDRMASVQPLLTGDPLVITSKFYDAELARLQTELVKMQEWIVPEGLPLCLIFEGRDTAGKGGTIKRIMERLNARNARGVAPGTPKETEKSQRYVPRSI